MSQLHPAKEQRIKKDRSKLYESIHSEAFEDLVRLACDRYIKTSFNPHTASNEIGLGMHTACDMFLSAVKSALEIASDDSVVDGLAYGFEMEYDDDTIPARYNPDEDR